MTPKFQIFVSSTFIDLKDERDQVIKATLEIGHIPVGMEMFNAGDDDQWKTIQRTIDQCDYYALILAHRYGSLDKDGIGYTEKEYDYAVSKGVPVMGFVLDSSASWPNDRRDNDHDAAQRALKAEKLEKFKNKVKGRMVNHWKNGDELQARFIASLSKIIVTHPRPGWVPATQAASPEMASELARLSKENAEFREREASQPVTFQPKIELTVWISWDTWMVASPGFGEQEEPTQGYRLHVRITNVGNLVCEAVSVIIKFPATLLADVSPRTVDENGMFESKIDLKVMYLSGSGFSSGSTPLLPGQFQERDYELTGAAVENQTNWEILYSIHPDQGFASEGSIPFDQIEIRSHKPLAPPSPDSIS